MKSQIGVSGILTIPPEGPALKGLSYVLCGAGSKSSCGFGLQI